MGRIDLLRFDSELELAQSAAARWIAQVRTVTDAGRTFSVALSGGRIAKHLFVATTEASRERSLSLDNVDFFWADERCVPPDDPESNFLLTQSHLILPLSIPAEKIHRIRGEMTPHLAATEAAAELARRVPANNLGMPILDLVFLGMGEDGHVASLFPDEPDAVIASPALYRAVVGPKPPPQRITMSYGVLAAAREVWVLASGPRKEDALSGSLSGQGQTPLARVIAWRSLTRIFTDIGGR